MSCACTCFHVGDEIVILQTEQETKGSGFPPELSSSFPGKLCFHPATLILASKVNFQNKEMRTNRENKVGRSWGENQSHGQVLS